ncbi:MAG: DUF3427 domain-containing protein [Actinobacteria bacterium]|nr:DUF3427 domain-containing protein [Actinomycetota bacterium]MCA1722334.1 DUF3427 domain-containing protein [Actinomycetota bacterium]
MDSLPAGAYEALHTARLDLALRQSPGLIPRSAPVKPAEVPDVLARHLADAVRRALAAEREPELQLSLLGRLLELLDMVNEQPTAALEQLVTLTRPIAPGVYALQRPVTPLSQAALLTNAADEPNLGAELRAEMSSADNVDLLCAFIRWPGLRVLESALMGLRERGAPLRVLTTTYIGATERRAIDELVNRFGAQVRISYETQSTRLHAKAWLFRRNSGYDSAFVGSSNLSRAALLDGLEWNVRLSGVATPDLLRKFEATFDSYWADVAFTPYNPAIDGDRLDDALARAGSRGGGPRTTISLAGLEVRALPHQDTILEALDAERQVHGRHRNLVVAATGTGKTVVAALDYRRLCAQHSRPLSLLFVAHRREILDQAQRTYREVMAEGAFGEPYVGGARPERWRHVFASVQSLASYGVDRLAPSHFDVVVIDEFHHAEAPTYRRLLDHLTPFELLGLTATPERADGVDVRSFFDGRTAYELRLWTALAADLLVPFHYFGVHDDVDLSGIEWKRGAYDVAGLERVYTGNDNRAAKVLAELRDKVTDVGTMRALGFCVSVAHAEYMARVFRDAGIPALAVSGQTRDDDRAAALDKLRRREVNALFAADLFNEGLDLPEIDTVLLLRPTQSATVFLQQLGRGLRRAHGKAVLTVLDFIGQQRREFRFDVRYRALTGASRRGLEQQIEQGFPYLPSGSQLVLDRVAEGIVLANVKRQLQLSRRDLVADARSHGDLPLADYLRESGRELADIYRRNGSWTSLRRDAGLTTVAAGPAEDALLRRMSVLAHLDDPERAALYGRLATPDGADYDSLSVREQRLARMLFFVLWPDKGGFSSYAEGLAHLRAHPAACAELRELVGYSVDKARHLPKSIGEGLQDVPLFSHAHYRREEILAALGWASWERSARGNITGVAWAEETATDALLINLRKTAQSFSPTTMYRDYAISPELFHWESQNATSTTSAAGKRYLTHRTLGTRVVLFVRETPTDELGAAPFLCLGQASYVEHRGERPIAITWKLARPMPGETFRLASVVAG